MNGPVTLAKPALAALAMAVSISAAPLALPSPPASSLPDPLQAGWHGNKVCVLLHENAQVRTLRCTFPPGGGHERHFHAAHWGYILDGSTMQITSASGTVVRALKAGDSWWSDGLAWHEALNIGKTTGVYLIVEPRALSDQSGSPGLRQEGSRQGAPRRAGW